MAKGEKRRHWFKILTGLSRTKLPVKEEPNHKLLLRIQTLDLKAPWLKMKNFVRVSETYCSERGI